MNILIVDDCELLRSFCSDVLEEQGHKTFQTSYKSFYDQYLKNGDYFDVVVINVDSTDIEAVKEVVIIARSTKSDVHIILLCHKWYEDNVKELIKEECISLTIPFNVKKFKDMIDNLNYLVVS